MPGYVCTYDDYDSDYEGAASYRDVVSEMGRGYRTHSAHSTRGTHSTTQTARKEEASSEGFGAGVM
jgi:stage V sporulation protein G